MRASASPEGIEVEWLGTASSGWVLRHWRGEPVPGGAAADMLLTPAEWLFRGALWLRGLAYGAGLLPARRGALPTVCVGNLQLGGSGKTPFAGWLVERLRELGARPALVHGGYGMDEPELFRRWYPDLVVVVERDRLEGVAAAAAAGAEVAVLDDAFQHRRLVADLSIVLLSTERWEPRPRLLPRGPWREGPRALGRAHVVAVTRRSADSARAAQVLRHGLGWAEGALGVSMRLLPDGWRAPGGGVTGPPPAPALLVAGIADPFPFLADARAAGAEVARAALFPDHHAYTRDDVDAIARRAGDRPVVTTEKDLVKLGGLTERCDVRVLAQRLEVERGREGLLEKLRGVLR